MEEYRYSYNKNNILGFGLMRLPVRENDGKEKVDIDLLKQMVDVFMERGFTYFDTAWLYNNFQSENAVKEAITSRYPRDAFTLTTKLHANYIKTPEDRDRIFDEQRRKTGVDFFDYYLIHDVNANSIEVYDRLNVWDWLASKKEQGLVKHTGFSFHDGPELLDKVLSDHPEIEYVQLQINYLDWDSEGIQSRKCYETAVKHGKQIIVMEPVKGGSLAVVPEQVQALFEEYNPEASVSSWAVRYAAGLKNVFKVLSGMSNMEQVLDNTGYMRNFEPLNDREKELVGIAVNIINGNIRIPCTACEYCMPGCPMNLAIPKYFSLYNADLQEIKSKGWTPQGEYYENLTRSHGKASDCIACGHCESMCPQHLPIIKDLREVAAYFEGVQS